MNKSMHTFLRKYLNDVIDNAYDLPYDYADYVGLEQEFKEDDEWSDKVAEELEREYECLRDATIVLEAVAGSSNPRPKETHEELLERMNLIHRAVNSFLKERINE